MSKLSSPSTKNLVFGHRLKKIRLERSLSQQELGLSIGLDRSVASARISRYESGVHEPALDIAQALARVLGVPLAYLYCEDDVLACLILDLHRLSASEQESLLRSLRDGQVPEHGQE